jgi:hypothetical protein
MPASHAADISERVTVSQKTPVSDPDQISRSKQSPDKLQQWRMHDASMRAGQTRQRAYNAVHRPTEVYQTSSLINCK